MNETFFLSEKMTSRNEEKQKLNVEGKEQSEGIEEEDDDDVEDEEEEEEYTEAEPVLTYSRMKNDVQDILTQDSVSCIKAGHKVFSNFV